MSSNITTSKETRNQRKAARWLAIILFAGVLCTFSVSAGLGLARQSLLQSHTTQLNQNAALGPHVLVTQVSGGNSSQTIELPGSIHGYIENPIYAKVAGYMKTINVDK